MLDSSLNQLYHIYDTSYSHPIIGAICLISVPYITVKFLDLSMVVDPELLFANNIRNLQRCLKTNYLWMYGYLLYSNTYWTHTIKTKYRSKNWSLYFPWLITKFVFHTEMFSLYILFKLKNAYIRLKNLNFILKNSCFTTDFPNIKIIV